MFPYVNLYVKSPTASANTPQEMKRADKTLTSIAPACFCAPNGTPIQEADGTFEVRVFDPQHTEYVKNILSAQFGLEVIRQEKHD